MRSSIFLRCISAFAIIILISFLMLSSIITVSIDDYAMDAKKSDIRLMGQITATIVSDLYKESSHTDFSDFAEAEEQKIASLLNALSPHTQDVSFIITDVYGRVVSTCIRTAGIPTVSIIPTRIVEQVVNNGAYDEYGKMNDLLQKTHLVSGTPIQNADRQSVGVIFACSSNAEADALIHVMNKSIILANLWIMLAVMVALYFITERLVSPLHEMGQAAKDFAKGKFETRIRVTGHDEISDFAKTFNNMAESLAQSENLRSTFLANVSHDLRTPMTTIAGYIDGIRDGVIPPEKQDYYLEIVSSEIHRLSRLVSKLLDISRMEAGMRKFTPTDFDVCELARLILISFEGKIEEKQLEVQFETAEDRMMVHADKDALHQILYNLCENAVKFSRVGGELRISIQAKEKNKYHITVYNEGEGIAAKDLPYVFDRFYKSDQSRGLDKVGVGLGLYIVKTMLTANGETIEAESEEGHHCSFTFTVNRSN